VAADTPAAARGVSALLFLTAGMNVLDAYSTLNSSPWTAESFGGDPAKMASLRKYVGHAAGYSTIYCVAAGVVAGSWWPVFGALVNNAYLWWLYRGAAQRGAQTGSLGWQSQTGQGWKGLAW
jgi:hypothetical protein